VVKDGKSEARPITVGNWEGDEWLVFEGLKAGEQVVVDGGLLLTPGMPLTVKSLAKPAGSPAPAVEPKTDPVKAGGKKS
jgi:membrane fusion protein (multidrug efflux system)